MKEAKPVKVDVELHGVSYALSCNAGEEVRLKEIVKLVDKRMNELAKRAQSASETRLLLLTCLTLADEAMEAKKFQKTAVTADEDLMVAAVKHLQQRVSAIAERVGHA